MTRLRLAAAAIGLVAVTACSTANASGGTAAPPATPRAIAADLSKDFGPRVITGIPRAPESGPATQLVVPLATISTPITNGTTAFVDSWLRAYDADQVNLVDNEVRCSGAGKSNVVVGENVLPPSGSPDHRDIKLNTRFLVSATATGTLTCTIYLRTASTSVNIAKETVEGNLRFADTSVGENAAGLAMQKSLPPGNTPVPTMLALPVMDQVLPAGYRNLDVYADVEYHRCADGATCPATYSTAKFELLVTTSGGPGCPSAPVASTQEIVPRGVNHAAIPLTASVPVQAGCDRVRAQVITTKVAGDTGTVGGAAVGLTDETGQSGDKPNHTSVMTHVFIVPS